MRFGYSFLENIHIQASLPTKNQKRKKFPILWYYLITKKQNQTKRSEPFHGPFYHRYLQNEMGNSQFRKKFFRTRKQILAFENFRVRSLISSNALNFHIMIAMTFLTKMTRKVAANALLKSVLDAARSIKDTVHFLYYGISYGIAEILKYARVGIRDWFKPNRTDQNQLRFRLSA